MRIKCDGNSGKSLSKSYLTIGYTTESVFDVSEGANYTVFGIAVYRGVVLYLLLDDLNLPNWFPRDLFKIVDARIESDWLCAQYQNEAGLDFLMGYPTLVADGTHYDALLERDPGALEIFRTLASSSANR
jgi:hypothetical protein